MFIELNELLQSGWLKIFFSWSGSDLHSGRIGDSLCNEPLNFQKVQKDKNQNLIRMTPISGWNILDE